MLGPVTPPSGDPSARRLGFRVGWNEVHVVPRSSPSPDARRGFLVRVILAVQAAIGSTLVYVLGRTIVGPSFAAHTPRWLDAAPLDELSDSGPTPVTLRIARQDGYRQVVDRRVVYLSRDGNGVVALDSTCTHLGCRTRFDAEAMHFVCPCHGGAYDVDGQVVAGPPPAPLRRLERAGRGRPRPGPGVRPGHGRRAVSTGSTRAPAIARCARHALDEPLPPAPAGPSPPAASSRCWSACSS